jgi:hypothetical protein
MAEQREASAEEKRALLAQLLEAYLAGENALQAKLGRLVPLTMSQEDQTRLLGRLMREPSTETMEDLMRRMLTKPDTPSFLSAPEQRMQDDLEASLLLHFRCYTKKPGQQQYSKSMAKFYEEYKQFIESGTYNQKNLKDTLQDGLPLECVFLTYGRELVRFLVLPPLSLGNKGCCLLVTTG